MKRFMLSDNVFVMTIHVLLGFMTCFLWLIFWVGYRVQNHPKSVVRLAREAAQKQWNETRNK